MVHILLIDTSAQYCTVGLVRDGQLLLWKQNNEQKSQAAVINVLIDELMLEIKLPLSSLDAIAVCNGPGSYTGLRVGLSSAKGLAYGLEIPIILHNKLELLAYQNIQKSKRFERYSILITARTDEFFFAQYDSEMHICQEPLHTNREKMLVILQKESSNSICIIGDEMAKEAIGPMVELCSEIDFTCWAEWASISFEKKSFADNATAVPYYMKEVYVYPARQTEQ